MNILYLIAGMPLQIFFFSGLLSMWQCVLLAQWITWLTRDNNDRNLKFSLFSLVIKNTLTFAKTSYFHFRQTAIVTYLFSLQ